jgi:hypothetical protein
LVKKVQAAVRNTLPAVAVIVGLFMVCKPVIAANPNPHSSAWAQEQPAPQPGDQNPVSETKTFTGKIVNKYMKVTGVLDPSIGMIRVSAIDPA